MSCGYPGCGEGGSRAVSAVKGELTLQSSCAVLHPLGDLLEYWADVGGNFSVTMLCFIFHTGVRGDQVEQSPSALSLQEGTDSTLRCNFSTTTTSVQWFLQNPGGSLINLFFIASGTKDNRRLKSTFNSKERYTTLHITDAQLEDSGTYLCAGETQCSQPACSLAPNHSWAFSATRPWGEATAALALLWFSESCCMTFISATTRQFHSAFTLLHSGIPL